MSRIDARFEALRASGKTALVPFLTAGDPDAESTLGLMHTLVGAGADIIEVGVPFSDPQADGPVIQRASERALAKGMSLRHVLELVSRFRQRDADTPVVLMGYLNPIEALGYQAFGEAAGRAGVDACLTVDLPPEEAGELVEALAANDIDSIFLAAPTTTTARLTRICAAGSGFIYYVSLKGVTGSGALDVDGLSQKLAALRALSDLPLAVGFGVKGPETAQAIARVADAVVVGSALIEAIERAQGNGADVHAAARDFLGALRQAVDAVGEQRAVT